MEQLNRYYRCSKISGRKFLRVLRHFALDVTASRTAQLTGLTRKTATAIFLKIRERIAEECERASPFSSCEVEVDESYFGARRVRGKRGRGASGKTIVFGIFKRMVRDVFHVCGFAEVGARNAIRRIVLSGAAMWARRCANPLRALLKREHVRVSLGET